MKSTRNVTGYWVMGSIAMVVAGLAPIVLIAGTFALTRMASATTSMTLVLCGIAAAASWWVSSNAHGFGKAGMALAFEEKYGYAPPWNR